MSGGELKQSRLFFSYCRRAEFASQIGNWDVVFFQQTEDESISQLFLQYACEARAHVQPVQGNGFVICEGLLLMAENRRAWPEAETGHDLVVGFNHAVTKLGEARHKTSAPNFIPDGAVRITCK